MTEQIKLSIEDQINDLKAKGIQFNLCPEKSAKTFLQNNTYYFKLKSYAKNYSNDNREHLYRDLDFAHLIELSKIDTQLRKIIFEMCLDIEHILKTRLIYACTCNNSTDGFDFIKEFLDNNYSVVLSLKTIAKSKSANSALAAKYYDADKDELRAIPLWVIVELLSFGEFIDLYTFYHQKYHSSPDYSSYLGSIKFLRNATAHNNCLIYSLRKKKEFSPTKGVVTALSKATKIKQRTKEHKMAIPVIHDFVTLLFVYNDLLNTPYNRNMRDKKMREINCFFTNDESRIRKKASYFQNNATLSEAYSFICDILHFINSQNNNPNFKRFIITRSSKDPEKLSATDSKKHLTNRLE